MIIVGTRTAITSSSSIPAFIAVTVTAALGGVRRVLKSEVLGPVSELSRDDAKERLRERLRA
jgi:hypothetical protein